MTFLAKYIKQPGEVLDYDFDFTQWFLGRTDTPATELAFADEGLTIVSTVRNGVVVKVVVMGGVDGRSYKLTVRLTTTAAIVREADILIKVKES